MGLVAALFGALLGMNAPAEEVPLPKEALLLHVFAESDVMVGRVENVQSSQAGLRVRLLVEVVLRGQRTGSIEGVWHSESGLEQLRPVAEQRLILIGRPTPSGDYEFPPYCRYPHSPEVQSQVQYWLKLPP
jgi:hypothetical protein